MRKASVLVAAVVGLAVAGLPAVAAAEAPVPSRIQSESARDGLRADFTGDGWPDILARERGTGVLRVYPHSTKVWGEHTFGAPVPINAGWQHMRWIEAMDLTGDGFADVVAVDQNWRMVVAVHSGTFDGTDTLVPGLVVVGYNWNVNNLVTATPWGLLARRAATGELVEYQTRGLHGTDTFAPPVQYAPGTFEPHGTDLFLDAGWIDRSGAFLFVTADGGLGARRYSDPSQQATFGDGWGAFDALMLADVNSDTLEDILVRNRDTGQLVAYIHSPLDPNSPRWLVFDDPTELGYGWLANDIIT